MRTFQIAPPLAHTVDGGKKLLLTHSVALFSAIHCSGLVRNSEVTLECKDFVMMSGTIRNNNTYRTMDQAYGNLSLGIVDHKSVIVGMIYPNDRTTRISILTVGGRNY